MYYVEVAPTKIIRNGSDSFTYSFDKKILVGTIVEIEVGRSKHVGVVVSLSKKPSYKVKPITRVIYETPIPLNLLKLAMWLKDYYKVPLSTCINTMLPRGVAKNRRILTTKNKISSIGERTQIVLNESQILTLRKLHSVTGTVLLHGVTGAGKTLIYIEQAKLVIASGKSVIILVPEIALTTQLIDEFSKYFSNILLTHSHQTEAQRHQIWENALLSQEPKIVIGPRSALFLPLKEVGLIVIDECHEPSFQQEKSPKYSALRVASKYADITSGLALFGSATPLVSDYFLAKSKNRVVTMSNRARTNSLPPATTIIDMTDRSNFRKHRFLSDSLIIQLETTFKSGKQALIFHNRRGSSSITLCENCGWQAGCPRCMLPLTLHADKHLLFCHICGSSHSVPTACPVCHHADIIHKGIGTKLVESELRKIFPSLKIARFDADVSHEENVSERYKELKDGSIQLIIGTQVVAKGLDLPKLETVGIIQADTGLGLPDYVSHERTFQLISQVVGRVGRSDMVTNVIIQSYQSSHPVIRLGVEQNYIDFYDRTIIERRKTHFPPDRFLLKLTCVYKTESGAINAAKLLISKLRISKSVDVELLGPTPSFDERVGSTYRWQIIAKSPIRQNLIKLIDILPPSHWQYELDPLSLL